MGMQILSYCADRRLYMTNGWTDGQMKNGWIVMRWGECRQGSPHLLYNLGRDDLVHLPWHTNHFIPIE